MKSLLLSILFFLSLVVHAQEDLLWDYSVKPETSEWKTLKTKKQMVDACQTPIEILNEIDTKEIGEIVKKVVKQ